MNPLKEKELINYSKFYYYIPKRERNYIIKEKINIDDDLKSIIKKNIKNFENPLNAQEFFENQIILDYIISEKYKNKNKINPNDIPKNGTYEDPMEDLLFLCKNKNINVYFDESIDEDLYAHLKKYYFNQNIFKKKLRIKLKLNKDIINNPEKINSIIKKIIMKLSEITKIPSEELCVTNVRKNCLLLDIYRWLIALPNRIIDFFHIIHLNEFIDFLNQIENENIILINENNDNRVQIQNVIQNFVINNGVIFDRRYNKYKGQFGRVFSIFGFLNYYKEFTIKNGKKYFYPNENCDGFGLRTNREDIFNNLGQEWCIVYKNLMNDEISYKINGISGNIIEKRYNDGTLKQFKIFYQCKIRQRTLLENFNGTLIFRGGPNDFIPYRIIKLHLNNTNRWQINI